MDSLYILIVCGVSVLLVLLALLKKHNDLRDVLATFETENNGLLMKKESYDAEIGSLNQNIAELTKEYMVLEQQLAASRLKENERMLEKERYKFLSFVEYLVAKGHVTEEDVKKAEQYRQKNISSMGVDEVLVLFNKLSSEQMRGIKTQYRADTDK